MFEKKLLISACLLVNVSCQSKCTVEIECYLTHGITNSSVVSQLVICPAILGSTEWKESDVNSSEPYRLKAIALTQYPSHILSQSEILEEM